MKPTKHCLKKGERRNGNIMGRVNFSKYIPHRCGITTKKLPCIINYINSKNMENIKNIYV
jgi:hypothetical protein